LARGSFARLPNPGFSRTSGLWWRRALHLSGPCRLAPGLLQWRGRAGLSPASQRPPSPSWEREGKPGAAGGQAPRHSDYPPRRQSVACARPSRRRALRSFRILSSARSMPIRLLRSLALACLLVTPAANAFAQELESPPSPASVLGHRVGESGWLAEWAEIVAYFERLDAASPRLELRPIGESVRGRPMIMAVITSVENHRRLEEIRAAQARLADPRTLP